MVWNSPINKPPTTSLIQWAPKYRREIGIIMIKKDTKTFNIFRHILGILNTFLFKIINIEKNNVIAMNVCPLGKLGSYSITNAFNNDGLGIFVIFLINKTRIFPTITFVSRKYAY